jgi:hypothetical protein
MKLVARPIEKVAVTDRETAEIRGNLTLTGNARIHSLTPGISHIQKVFFSPSLIQERNMQKKNCTECDGPS